MKKSRIILLVILLACLTFLCVFLVGNQNHDARAQKQARLTALEVIYVGAKESFGLWELVPDLDWDGLYKAYQKKVRAADSDWDYYLELQRFVAHLKDGHSSVYIPDIAPPYYLPLGLRYVEGRYVVVGAYYMPLRDQLGSVVTAINGVETDAFLEARLGDRTGMHTPGTRQDTLATMLIHWGSPDTLTLDCIGPDGTAFKAQVAYERVDYPLQWLNRPLSGSKLGNYATMTVYAHANDVYRVVLPSFVDFSLQDEFARFIAEYGQKASAFIFDVRGNHGGNALLGLDILTYFSKLDDLLPLESTTNRTEALSEEYRVLADPLLAQFDFEKQVLLGQPVVILTDWWCSSAAEDFAAYSKNTGRFTLIGTHTAGATGQKVVYSLSGGAGQLTAIDTSQGSFEVSSARIRWGEGFEITNLGIPPDIWAEQTLSAQQNGRDTALEAALAYLARLR